MGIELQASGLELIMKLYKYDCYLCRRLLVTGRTIITCEILKILYGKIFLRQTEVVLQRVKRIREVGN